MSFSLSDATLRLLDGRNYAVLATINADGSPHTSAMWIGRDGNDLLFSTVQGRVKYRNMQRDPRVSITIIESANPENYVELRGTASITPEPDRVLHIELARKYDRDPGQDAPGAVRAIVRVTVHKATGYSA
jgi:PPOX class probable F420-dependent enzyme